MKSAAFLVLFACLAITSAAPTAQQRGAATKTAQIYVSVVDDKGAAVPGLSVRDFAVREDGNSREVLKVEPATEPLDIMLVVDDSQAATAYIPYLRDGLTRFVDRMQGKAQIGLVTMGERPTSVVEYTTDVAALKKGIGRVFARPGSGAYLLEAVRDVSRGLQRREGPRPTIVALTTEGVEFSNLQYERVIEEIRKSDATFHALAIGTPAAAVSDELRNRGRLLSEGTKETGGRQDQLLTPMAIPDRMAQLADELLNQYLVTYGRPETLIPPEKVQVTTTKAGLTARARTRPTTKK
jgi:VWFA-related protein